MTAEAIEKLHPLVKAMLKERGIEDAESISNFLEPSYDEHLHDPFLMRDMDRVVARILAAIEKKERIAIYADFDCDGIPGAALLSSFFEKIEYDNIEVYIPNRTLDGYGLHQHALDILKERGVTLVITVDLGIAANDAVAYANTLGIEVIVTDHHEPPERLPDAYALINPKLPPALSGVEGYPFGDLCGAGVAFKVVCALLAEGRTRELPAFIRIQEGWEKWLLDLVAIATIADMVPLIGENRVLARYGLLVLRKTPRPGIVALMRLLRTEQSSLTEDDIGFTIGPRINAASKMNETEIALRLLTARSAREAEGLASAIEALNKKRKAQAAAITREVHKRMKERHLENSPVIVLGDPSWQSVMLGPVANTLVGEHGGVVCLWGSDGAGKLKGSCRSDGSLSVVELFRAAGELFEEAGGHHASGGFTISKEQVHHLGEALSDAAQTLRQKDTTPEGQLYAASISDCSDTLYNSFSLCAPFGMGNEKPLFALASITVERVSQFGKANEHLEIVFVEGERRVKGVRFFAKPESFEHTPAAGARVTALAHLERSSFRGKSELRLRLVDIVSPEKDTHATIVSI